MKKKEKHRHPYTYLANIRVRSSDLPSDIKAFFSFREVAALRSHTPVSERHSVTFAEFAHVLCTLLCTLDVSRT